MSVNRIRVLIVDDHAVVRGGLRLFLLAFEDLDLVGEASSGEDAIELCKNNHPDVVLMDLLMPGIGGIQTIKEVKNHCPQIQIIALTSFPEENLVQDSLKAGAISYLLKNVSANELANAIRAAYHGRATLSPEATQALIDASQNYSDASNLTKREKEVLTLIVNGKSNSEIAAELVLSLSTVKYHVSSILSKLNVSSRAEAVSFTLQNKILDMN